MQNAVENQALGNVQPASLVQIQRNFKNGALMKNTTCQGKSLHVSARYISHPADIYARLCQENYTLLLESAEISSKKNLKSILLKKTAVKIICRGCDVEISALTENGYPILDLLRKHAFNSATVTDSFHSITYTFGKAARDIDEASRLMSENPFSVLRFITQHIKPDSPSPYSVFLAGVFAYDMIAVIEELPDVLPGENTCPDYVFYLAETLLVIDHAEKTTELIHNLFGTMDLEARTKRAFENLAALKNELEAIEISPATMNPAKSNSAGIEVDTDDAAFMAKVDLLKSHIVRGDIFQVVPSRTFRISCRNPILSYIALKQQNPSPYMFFMQDVDFTLFGASPESALKYCNKSRSVEVYPIAGTRPRGKHPDGEIAPDLDSRIELEMRNDEKEQAEHLMLVDLARNDIARVSVPGTRHVAELLKVDRYSHVMHLVSRVQGTLRPELDALHAYQACMNMGTLVGAPKLMASSLIRKVERKRRGSYGGAIGYLNGEGDMDTCIIIRSAFVRNGIAQIQAGAGVVFDSIPKNEADETRSKAQAVINAISTTSCYMDDYECETL